MPATLGTLSRDTLNLQPEQRLALACRLLTSVEPEPEGGVAAAWETEIGRRIARFDAGESQPVSAGEVFANLRKIAPINRLDSATDEKIQQAWAAKAVRRHDEVRSGRVKTIPGDEAMAQVRRSVAQ